MRGVSTKGPLTLNVRVDMGKLRCGMQTQQWNDGIVKNVTQNRASQSCNNIPLW